MLSSISYEARFETAVEKLLFLVSMNLKYDQIENVYVHIG